MTEPGIVLRKYNPADCTEIMQLFYDTVHTVNAADYTQKQLEAWAPAKADITRWGNRLWQDYALVAESGGVIVGIGTWKGSGYFDLLYVHKSYQRRGVASLLADAIESYARTQNSVRLTVDASVTARPFFEKRGFALLQKQAVSVRGQMLTNYRMEKIL